MVRQWKLYLMSLCVLQRVLSKRIDEHMNSLTESDDKDSHESQGMQDVNRKNVSKIQYLLGIRKSVQYFYSAVH